MSNMDFRNDVLTMREYIMNAYRETDKLRALAMGAPMSPASLQETLEQAAAQYEYAVVYLRRIYDKYLPGVGGYPRRLLTEGEHPVGSVELLRGRWLRITINTLLPHCRYASPTWLTDTIARLLDGYQREHDWLPRYDRAHLVIEEFCDIGGRHIFDQDNKGWKAISNAIKGRLIADDDQFTLSITLHSDFSEDNYCRMTLLPQKDVAEFFAMNEKGQQK